MTTTPTASPAPPDLARLEALARAADQGEGQHIYTNPRDSNGWQANEAWHRAASPAAVLELIALARRAALANQPAPTVPATREAIEEAAQVFEAAAAHNRSKGRTILAHSQQSRADLVRKELDGAPAHQPAQEQGEPVAAGYISDDAAAMLRAGRPVSVAVGRNPSALGAVPIYFSAQQEPVAAPQQAGAPGALYSYMGESGRYELIGQAVGAGKCRLIDPLTVYRDTATDSLYLRHPGDFAARMVAINASAPGTPEAPSQLMQALTTGIPLQEPVYIAKALRAQREVRVSLAGGTGQGAAAFLVNIQMAPWTYTKETAQAYAWGYNRALKDYRAALLDVAAQLDGGRGDAK